MVSLESFLISYGQPFAYILGAVIFLGFIKACYTVGKAVFRFFKRGIYEV